MILLLSSLYYALQHKGLNTVGDAVIDDEADVVIEYKMVCPVLGHIAHSHAVVL